MLPRQEAKNLHFLPEASASALPPILEEQNPPRNPEDGVIEENSEDEQITEAQLQMQKANLEQDIATEQHSKNIRSSLIEAEAEYSERSHATRRCKTEHEHRKRLQRARKHRISRKNQPLKNHTVLRTSPAPQLSVTRIIMAEQLQTETAEA